VTFLKMASKLIKKSANIDIRKVRSDSDDEIFVTRAGWDRHRGTAAAASSEDDQERVVSTPYLPKKASIVDIKSIVNKKLESVLSRSPSPEGRRDQKEDQREIRGGTKKPIIESESEEVDPAKYEVELKYQPKKGENPVTAEWNSENLEALGEKASVVTRGVQTYESVLRQIEASKKVAKIKPGRDEKKGKSYCFTDYYLGWAFWQNYLNDGPGGKANLIPRYFVAGNETCPKTGKSHIQGFIMFKNDRSFSAVRKELFPCHIEQRKASVEKNLQYCSKDGDFIEIGEPSHQGQRTDLKQLHDDMFKKNMTTEDVMYEQPDMFQVCLQYGRGMDRATEVALGRKLWADWRASQAPEILRDWMNFRKVRKAGNEWCPPEVICIWGPPGIGKSKLAWEMCQDPCTLMLSGDRANPFVHGWNGGPCVIFNDFDTSTANREWLLNICDGYPIHINLKGGSASWNVMKILFTSNDDPNLWYVDSKGGNDAWKRRIKVVNMFEKNPAFKASLEWKAMKASDEEIQVEAAKRKCDIRTMKMRIRGWERLAADSGMSWQEVEEDLKLQRRLQLEMDQAQARED